MAPSPAPAPFVTAVRPEWIDYNGHLNEGYFVVAFSLASDSVLDQLGVGERYHATTGRSMFTAEAHIRYLAQVRMGDELHVRGRVIGVDAKRLRLWHEMVVDDSLRATQEVMMLHVDVAAGRSVPLSAEMLARIRAVAENPPAEAGGSIRPTRSE